MIDTVIAEKYKIEEKIASGGMGVVYKAIDSSLDRVVAIKKLHSDQSKDKIIKEAKNTAKLNHHNICQVYEVVEHDNESYLVMEYIDGFTLSDLIEKSKKNNFEFSEAFTMGILGQVLSGLEHAHNSDESKDQKILHRDLTPSNIMVTKHGNVKILDFGISKVTDSLDKTVTKGGESYNVEYTSPELWQNGIYSSDNYSESCELYSLGLIIYELLCKEKAQPGFAVITKGHKYASVESIRPISEDYDRYLQGLLSKKPGGRFVGSRVALANLDLLPSYQKNASATVIQEEISLLLTNKKSMIRKGTTQTVRIKRIDWAKFSPFKVGLIATFSILFFMLLGLLVSYYEGENSSHWSYVNLEYYEPLEEGLSEKELEIVKVASKLERHLSEYGLSGYDFLKPLTEGNDKSSELVTVRATVKYFEIALNDIKERYVKNRSKILESFHEVYKLPFFKYRNHNYEKFRSSWYRGYPFKEDDIFDFMIFDLWYYGYYRKDPKVLVQKLKEVESLLSVYRNNHYVGLREVGFINEYRILKMIHLLKILKPNVFLSKDFLDWFNSFEIYFPKEFHQRFIDYVLWNHYSQFYASWARSDSDLYRLYEYTIRPFFYLDVETLERFALEYIILKEYAPWMDKNKHFMRSKCEDFKRLSQFRLFPPYNIMGRIRHSKSNLLLSFCSNFLPDEKLLEKFDYLKRNYNKDFNLFEAMQKNPDL